MNDFQEWLKTTPEYQTLVFQHGERLFIQRDGEFENLTVRLAYRAWSTQQVNIDQLNNVLDERTKEWLQAIECGSYFENIAKPLKQQYDDIKTQLNNMEQCYIQLKQEHNELIAFNTVQDRKQKAAEKVAEKYKRKVLMIADLLRDSTDKDMTLKAIQTVIERVGEHV